MWYGSEVISHFEDGDEFEAVYDSCVVIHLAEVTNDVSTTLLKIPIHNTLKINSKSETLYPIYTNVWKPNK